MFQFSSVAVRKTNLLIIFRVSPDEKQNIGLLEYMEGHSFFALEQITKLGPNGKRTFGKMWTNLAQHLNSLGPAKRDVAGWKTVS